MVHPTNNGRARLRRLLSGALAALVTATGATAQTADVDTVRQLQEQVEALRRQVVQLGGTPVDGAPVSADDRVVPAPRPPAAGSRAAGTSPASTSRGGGQLELESGMQTLSPFEVATDRETGYVRTNSVTATRIGVRIQDTPLQVQVISSEFIEDLAMRDINDVMRYTATAAGDSQMGVLQPATGFTPSGRISTRGFPINARLKNSVRRYTLYSLDNVERVELIRGPASVFFGQSFPGGVINYVTKRPEFRTLPTELSYTITADGGNRATADQNVVLLRDKIAARTFLSWENSQFQRDFEYRQGFSVIPQIKVNVFENLSITGELEYTERRENIDAYTWMWPAQWFADYANPPADLIAVAPAAVREAADPVAAYRARIGGQGFTSWIADVRAARNFYEPLYTGFRQGPVAERMAPDDFNVHGRDTRSEQEVTDLAVTVDYTPFEWFSTRYMWNRAHAYYYEQKAQARPNADGQTYNTLVGLTWRYYDNEDTNHILDNVLTFDVAGIRNKILFGGIYRENVSKYGGVPPFGADYRLVPGATTNAETIAQTLYDRNGNPLTPQQVYSNYDPELHVFPGLDRITQTQRAVQDRYLPKTVERYINYQGTLLDNRLHLMAGFRDEKTYNRQQQVNANPPWYMGFEDMILTLPEELQQAYGQPGARTPGSYQLGTLRNESGDSMMFGAAFNLTRDITLYASTSESYLPNGGFQANYNESEVRTRAELLGLDPDAELARIRAAGSDEVLGNETGTNLEAGIKASLWDNRLVATAAIFRLERQNQRLDDATRSNNDPLNYDRNGARTANIVRWFNAEALQRTEGAEIEVIWTPIRNYQLVTSGGWLWTAETVTNPSITPTHPDYYAVFNRRLPNAPEYTLKAWNKYTFTDGMLNGFSVGGGFRYSSSIVIGNTRDWGFEAGNFTVFDAMLGYTTELWGVRSSFTMNVTNVTDKEYSEGGWNLARGREFSFTGRFHF